MRVLTGKVSFYFFEPTLYITLNRVKSISNLNLHRSKVYTNGSAVKCHV